MKKSVNKITEIISEAKLINEYSNEDWNQLISEARFHDLLPLVHQIITVNSQIKNVPEEVIQILDGYLVRLKFKQTLLLWEIGKIQEIALRENFPVVVLKGMAYMLDELGIYESRNFVDIDILVEQSRIHMFENLLLEKGWYFKELSDYDEHYYREWSHASPPLIHKDSGIELDLHHNISSPISNIKIDTSMLLKQIQPTKNEGLYRLSDVDLILHCANHFIYFDDLQGKFKDLIHIYYMLKQIDRSNIWEELYIRAEMLGFQDTWYYLVRLLDYFFEVELPQELHSKTRLNTFVNIQRAIIFQLLKKCIAPENVDDLSLKIMNKILLARYQWTRYPFGILLKHLFKKHLLRKILNQY